MSKAQAYKYESALDVVIRNYGNIEGLIQYCQDNSLSLDSEEESDNVRQINDAVVSQTVKIKALFSGPPSNPLRKVIIDSKQSVVDLAIQETGSIEGLINVLKGNGLSCDSDPVAGNELKVSGSDIVDQTVVSFYRDLKKKVNTGDFEEPVVVHGIGYMIIGSTFKVG